MKKSTYSTCHQVAIQTSELDSLTRLTRVIESDTRDPCCSEYTSTRAGPNFSEYPLVSMTELGKNPNPLPRDGYPRLRRVPGIITSQSTLITEFMDFSPNSALHKAKEGRPATRSSLACLPCRSRHVKCDGTRPHCSRCVESETQCDYTKSRRGGLDRATLAERRKQLAAADRASSIANLALPSSPSVLVLAGAQQQDKDQTCLFAGPPGRLFPASLTDRSFNIEHDSLIESYYKTFHKFHPFVLPRTHLARLSQDPGRQPSLKPLVAVIRFIGHLYDSQEWSTTLKDSVDVFFSEAPHTDPFMVQCRLLYSMALFWRGYSADSKREMDAAVRLALHLEMFRREFAINYGCGDAMLTESWRRTWWTLYLVDGYYAGTLGTMKSEFMDVEATADLPCEEHEFESGVSSEQH